MSSAVTRRAIPPAREAANKPTIDALVVAVNELSGTIGAVISRAVRVGELVDAGIVVFTDTGQLQLKPLDFDLESVWTTENFDPDTKANATDVESGTYVPTFTLTTNANAVANISQWQFMRVKDVVHCGGRVDITPNASGAVEVQATLPFASDFVSFSDCTGAGATVSNSVRIPLGINADPTNNRVRISLIAANTFVHQCFFSFTFIIK